jgi:hypothetical protein
VVGESLLFQTADELLFVRESGKGLEVKERAAVFMGFLSVVEGYGVTHSADWWVVSKSFHGRGVF